MKFSPSFGRGAGFAGGADPVFLCQCIDRINMTYGNLNIFI